jgi:hypothetical protein
LKPFPIYVFGKIPTTYTYMLQYVEHGWWVIAKMDVRDNGIQWWHIGMDRIFEHITIPLKKIMC